jgi:RNA polymerase sigma factor (sigma-70 family)
MTIDRRRLLNAARRLLPQADAEDAVQDTLVRALSAFPDLLQSQPAWLHSVLRNIAIDRLRRKKLESAHIDAVLPSEEASGDLIEIRSECEAALRHLLSRASFAEGAAILLRDVFEFEFDEIARLLGKSEAATRQFLHRARARVRDKSSPTDVEDLYVGLCWRAIEERDAAILTDMLQLTTACAQPAAISAGQRAGRGSSILVHVGGRYAIALVLDGVVLCLVPVGTQASLAREAA